MDKNIIQLRLGYEFRETPKGYFDHYRFLQNSTTGFSPFTRTNSGNQTPPQFLVSCCQKLFQNFHKENLGMATQRKGKTKNLIQSKGVHCTLGRNDKMPRGWDEGDGAGPPFVTAITAVSSPSLTSSFLQSVCVTQCPSFPSRSIKQTQQAHTVRSFVSAQGYARKGE